MLCMGTNGDLHTCHGIMYFKPRQETWGNIQTTPFEDILDEMLDRHKTSDDVFPFPDECMKCSATHCAICNAVVAVESEKDSATERWFDRNLLPQICKYYKVFGLYDKALHTIMGSQVH